MQHPILPGFVELMLLYYYIFNINQLLEVKFENIISITIFMTVELSTIIAYDFLCKLCSCLTGNLIS